MSSLAGNRRPGHHRRTYNNRRDVDGPATPATQDPFRHVNAPATYEAAANSTALEGIHLDRLHTRFTPTARPHWRMRTVRLRRNVAQLAERGAKVLGALSSRSLDYGSLARWTSMFA